MLRRGAMEGSVWRTCGLQEGAGQQCCGRGGAWSHILETRSEWSDGVRGAWSVREGVGDRREELGLAEVHGRE